MTLTELRKNIYSIFDDIAKTGRKVVIDRNGTKIIIMVQKSPSKLERLKSSKNKKAYNGDSDEIIGMNWEAEWKEKHI